MAPDSMPPAPPRPPGWVDVGVALAAEAKVDMVRGIVQFAGRAQLGIEPVVMNVPTATIMAIVGRILLEASSAAPAPGAGAPSSPPS